MKYILHTLVATAVAVTFAAARPQAAAESQHKKGAAAHTMTGCLQKGTEANTYVLSNVDKGPKTVEIIGAASGVDLNAHVGHKVTLTGTSVGEKAAAKAEAKAEGKGTSKEAVKKEMKEEAGEHHMKVTGLKMVSTTCS